MLSTATWVWCHVTTECSISVINRGYSILLNREKQEHDMVGVLVHDSVLQGYTSPGTTWANDMNFIMNHAPGAGSIP